MKKNKYAIILLCVIFTLTGLLQINLAASMKGTKHDFGCSACHNIHYPKGPALFALPLETGQNISLTSVDTMCYSCHKGENKGGKFFFPGHSHPINVVPSGRTKIPKVLGTKFVEGVGRVITCVSCHDPHSQNPKFLKITPKDDLLCRACHTEY